MHHCLADHNESINPSLHYTPSPSITNTHHIPTFSSLVGIHSEFGVSDMLILHITVKVKTQGLNMAIWKQT